jgi:hypothetical protein
MRSAFHSALRSRVPPDWMTVRSAWQRIIQTKTHIDFESLFRDIMDFFARNPSQFLTNIRKSHHLPQSLLVNWPDLGIQAKTNHFLAHFRFVFAFDDLEVFVKQANI